MEDALGRGVFGLTCQIADNLVMTRPPLIGHKSPEGKLAVWVYIVMAWGHGTFKMSWADMDWGRTPWRSLYDMMHEDTNYESRYPFLQLKIF